MKTELKKKKKRLQEGMIKQLILSPQVIVNVDQRGQRASIFNYSGKGYCSSLAWRKSWEKTNQRKDDKAGQSKSFLKNRSILLFKGLHSISFKLMNMHRPNLAYHLFF